MPVLVAALLLTSCGPSAREVCQRSLDNRANGLYANLSKEHQAAAYLDFAGGCLESCIGEIEAVQGNDKPLSVATESAVCREADWLVAGGSTRHARYGRALPGRRHLLVPDRRRRGPRALRHGHDAAGGGRRGCSRARRIRPTPARSARATRR